MSPEEEERFVFLDLKFGTKRSAELAAPVEPKRVNIVVEEDEVASTCWKTEVENLLTGPGISYRLELDRSSSYYASDGGYASLVRITTTEVENAHYETDIKAYEKALKKFNADTELRNEWLALKKKVDLRKKLEAARKLIAENSE